MASSSRLLLLFLLSIVVLCTAYRIPLARVRKSLLHTTTMLSMSTAEVQPGSPIIKKIDESTKIAYMTIALSGEQTQKAFNSACDMFNEVNIIIIFTIRITGQFILLLSNFNGLY